MSKITGNGDGQNGSNDSYRIGNRFGVPRTQATNEVELGLHPGYHTVEIDGETFVRGNPNGSSNDNVNK